jgi:hypothetical protein
LGKVEDICAWANADGAVTSAIAIVAMMTIVFFMALD